MKWYRFIQTTIGKLCESQTVGELDKVYSDAKNGWKTAKGEDRGGFDRFGLSAVDILLINNVYDKIRKIIGDNKND